MLFSVSVTSKLRFMQSSGVREDRAAALICPRRHSNRAWSDTSINSPSPTKFTLVFRTLRYFISSCRISQSYFQSLSCHHCSWQSSWQSILLEVKSRLSTHFPSLKSNRFLLCPSSITKQTCCHSFFPPSLYCINRFVIKKKSASESLHSSPKTRAAACSYPPHPPPRSLQQILGKYW